MQFSTASLLVAALAATTSAHMNMADPPPLKYKGNPNAKTVDSDITSPNTAATFPCKGALDVFDSDEGKPVATWAPGSQQTVTLEGGAAHNGGSCQMSLSYDSGSTWTVIYSKEGNCPTEKTLQFTVPEDTPTGDKVLLAWSWINHTGNREFYMNCASISIGGGSSKRDESAKPKRDAVSYKAQPAMFVANLEGKSDYCVKEGVDVLYPQPGAQVDKVTTSGGAPTNCQSGQEVSGDSADSGSGASSSAAASTPATTAAGSATASASAPGGVFLTLPTGGASSDASTAPAATSAATTFQTQTAASSSAAATTNTGASSSAAASKTASAPASESSGSVSGAQSGACSSEGQWACSSDGSSFQRCASGQWSAAISMAAGTSCTPGISDTLSMARRQVGRVRRAVGTWETN